MMKEARILLGSLLILQGCAQLMGGLREDFDDSVAEYERPTYGGRWAERGLLDDEDGPPRGHIGHMERRPAMMPSSQAWTDESAPQQLIDPSKIDPALAPRGSGKRVTRSDFVDESQNEGSLWASDGQTNYYFTKNKIRGVGDIVSVNIDQDLHRDIITEIKRTLTPKEKDKELKLAEARLRARVLGLPDPDPPQGSQARDQIVLAQSSERGPASIQDAKDKDKQKEKEKEEELQIRPVTSADIDVARGLALRVNEQFMTEIVERYPNGNYRLRGTKRLMYRGNPRVIVLTGIAKSSDISEEDQIASSKLYEYRVEGLQQ